LPTCLGPIMLTTVTTIMGLIPMALAINVNFIEKVVAVGSITAIWWIQLSTAIISGLGFSTVLTLVMIPVMLSLPVNIKSAAGWVKDVFTRSQVEQLALASGDINAINKLDSPEIARVPLPERVGELPIVAANETTQAPAKRKPAAAKTPSRKPAKRKVAVKKTGTRSKVAAIKTTTSKASPAKSTTSTRRRKASGTPKIADAAE